jgi:Predicted membrane protein (DUF2339)
MQGCFEGMAILGLMAYGLWVGTRLRDVMRGLEEERAARLVLERRLLAMVAQLEAAGAAPPADAVAAPTAAAAPAAAAPAPPAAPAVTAPDPTGAAAVTAPAPPAAAAAVRVMAPAAMAPARMDGAAQQSGAAAPGAPTPVVVPPAATLLPAALVVAAAIPPEVAAAPAVAAGVDAQPDLAAGRDAMEPAAASAAAGREVSAVGPAAASVAATPVQAASVDAGAAGGTAEAGGRPGGPAGGAGGRPPRRERFDWESFIGVKLFSWAAGVLLAVSAIFFLRYSIDHGFLTSPVRLALGLALGAGLLVVCELRVARRYAVTANALDAAGIVILFATLFAAHALWHLLGAPAAFALMILVTVVAVGLAVHHNSLFIALLGLFGGFATPALLSTGQDRPLSLFGYLLLLNAGLAWVALRRSWPWLSVLALAFTTLYQWTWVARFLSADKLPLALGIFLVFPLVGLTVAARARRGGGGAGGVSIVERSAAVATTMPLAFALYAMSVRAYGEHFGLLFGFLLLLDVALAAVAAWRGPRLLHEVGAGATLVGLVVWLSSSYRSTAWPGILFFVSLFVLFYLAAPGLARRLGRPLGDAGRRAALAAPCFLLALPVLAHLEPAAAAPGLTFGVLFALLAAVAAYALVEQHGAPHFIAAFFAIAAQAVWAAEHLTPQRLLAGIAIFAVFGLFYAGVPVVARRLGRTLAPRQGGAIVLLCSLALLFFLTAGTVAPAALWGFALLLVILQAGLIVEAARIRHPILALVGTVLSWLLIGIWWSAVPLAASLVPALALVAGFTVFGLAGSVWLARGGRDQHDAATADLAGNGAYLALVGHVFILFVASQQQLALPPWPLLGALALLDLAIGVAALWMRRAALWIAALVASDVIVVVWLHQAGSAPWPAVALAASATVSALGLVWIALARRVAGAGAHGARGAGSVPGAADAADGSDGSGNPRAWSSGFAEGASAVLFLGQLVAAATTVGVGAPSLGAAIVVQVASLVAILALAGPAGWPPPAPLSVVTTAVAVGAWHAGGAPVGAGHPWWTDLVFAVALYVPYLLYPVLLGERARRLKSPHLAAVLASVPFFLFARVALIEGGWGAWIGVLPVAQALALGGLLVTVRRMEAAVPPAERDRGRLALIAGAILAMLTVAIPLQLDREWITIGWALLAAALAWLYTRIPHRGLLLWTAGLLAAVFLRLAVNPSVLAYHPRGGLPVWNWYLYTYLVPAVAFFVAARLLIRGGDPRLSVFGRLSALASGAAVVLLFLLLNIEIADYFSTGVTVTFGFLGGKVGLAESLSYTLGWGIFAICLLVAGIALRSRPARVAAISLLLAASLKGFLLDMSQLGGLYRVGSFAGLAACLALVAVLLQKFVLAQRDQEAP